MTIRDEIQELILEQAKEASIAMNILHPNIIIEKYIDPFMEILEPMAVSLRITMSFPETRRIVHRFILVRIDEIIDIYAKDRSAFTRNLRDSIDWALRDLYECGKEE